MLLDFLDAVVIFVGTGVVVIIVGCCWMMLLDGALGCCCWMLWLDVVGCCCCSRGGDTRTTSGKL